MCSVLPNVEENECQQFVDNNYQSIMKAIQIGTNPTVACMALMVCDKDMCKQKLFLINLKLSDLLLLLFLLM